MLKDVYPVHDSYYSGHSDEYSYLLYQSFYKLSQRCTFAGIILRSGLTLNLFPDMLVIVLKQIKLKVVAKEITIFKHSMKVMAKQQLYRMDNMGIVVNSLDDAISFFTEIGLQLEGRGIVEGPWAGKVTGLGDQKVEIAMMVTPDGHSRLELSRFIDPAVVADHREAPVNALGYLRVMFTVADIEELLSRLYKLGASLVGEVVQYENAYKLCYIRGVEGLLIGLAEPLNGAR